MIAGIKLVKEYDLFHEVALLTHSIFCEMFHEQDILSRPNFPAFNALGDQKKNFKSYIVHSFLQENFMNNNKVRPCG